MSTLRQHIIIAFHSLLVLVMTVSCANMGTPGGGPRDEDPPRLVAASPAPGSVNVDKTRITLTFDELVNVKDAFSKVVVSPVTRSTPKVTYLGKRVYIDFDSLAPNTTYTVDFADAIEDNNEGNTLQGFSYSFSTGPELDSLRISGRVLSARALEPQQSMIVGVHKVLDDSAFTRLPLLRVAKTDDKGQFTIRGLAEGTYRVFALADRDNDYTYSTPEEDMAFYDFTVTPSSESVTVTDTLYNPLTGAIDTLRARTRTRFLPNDILLRSFNSEKRTQYLSKYERQDSTKIFLKFNTRASSLPQIAVVGSPQITSIGTLEASERLDSLVYWLSPELMRRDSIALALTYLRTDSTSRLSSVTDTLEFNLRRIGQKKASKKPKKISVADSLAAITTTLRVSSSNVQDVNKPLTLELPSPALRFNPEAFKLLQMVDSTYLPVRTDYYIEQADSLSPRNFVLNNTWEYDTKYRLEVDTMAITDIYGKPTRPLQFDFKTKSPGDYCSLTFELTGLDEWVPAFVELLNGSDAVQRTERVVNGTVFFPFLTPGRYYARVIEDVNGNGEYDTGDYDLGLQPELAYYYPKAINIKKNWDKKEPWAVFDTAIDMMKPAAILKNRPNADKRARNNKTNTDEEDEDEDYFDPSRNPFDPNDKSNRRNQLTGTSY